MADNKKQSNIEAIIEDRKTRLTSHIYLLYWDMQEWVEKRWAQDGKSDISIDHLKLLYLIATGDSKNNNELAKFSGVTRQAMSQMVCLLEKRGVVTVQPNPNDSRSKLISLSDSGFEFMEYFGNSTADFFKEYTELIGQEKMDQLTKITMELSQAIIKRREGSATFRK